MMPAPRPRGQAGYRLLDGWPRPHEVARHSKTGTNHRAVTALKVLLLACCIGSIALAIASWEQGPPSAAPAGTAARPGKRSWPGLPFLAGVGGFALTYALLVAL